MVRVRARVFRDLQNNWQAHDAYARACLALGTYKLIHALAYYTVGLERGLEAFLRFRHVGHRDACPVGWLRVRVGGSECGGGLSPPRVVLPTLAWLLMRPSVRVRLTQWPRLDLYFASTLRMVGALALMLGPVLALVAATLTSLKSPQRIDVRPLSHLSDARRAPRLCRSEILVAIIFTMHAMLIARLTCEERAHLRQVCVNIVARAELVTERGAALPTRFRNVLYLDVFGWLEAKPSECTII